MTSGSAPSTREVCSTLSPSSSGPPSGRRLPAPTSAWIVSGIPFGTMTRTWPTPIPR